MLVQRKQTTVIRTTILCLKFSIDSACVLTKEPCGWNGSYPLHIFMPPCPSECCRMQRLWTLMQGTHPYLSNPPILIYLLSLPSYIRQSRCMVLFVYTPFLPYSLIFALISHPCSLPFVPTFTLACTRTPTYGVICLHILHVLFPHISSHLPSQHSYSMYANPDVWCYLSTGQVSNGFVMDDTAPLVDETTTTGDQSFL